MTTGEKRAYNNGFLLGFTSKGGIQLLDGLSGEDTVYGHLINNGSSGTWPLVFDGDAWVAYPQLSSCKYSIGGCLNNADYVRSNMASKLARSYTTSVA